METEQDDICVISDVWFSDNCVDESCSSGNSSPNTIALSRVICEHCSAETVSEHLLAILCTTCYKRQCENCYESPCPNIRVDYYSTFDGELISCEKCGANVEFCPLFTCCSRHCVECDWCNYDESSVDFCSCEELLTSCSLEQEVAKKG